MRHYNMAGLSITIGTPSDQFYERRVALESDRGPLFKQQTADGIYSCYTLQNATGVDALIRGYHRSQFVYSIQRIENVRGDNFSGAKTLPFLYQAVELDLRKSGIIRVETLSQVKLAPILIKRYGFTADSGQSYESLKNSWLRHFPFKAVSLHKYLPTISLPPERRRKL